MAESRQVGINHPDVSGVRVLPPELKNNGLISRVPPKSATTELQKERKEPFFIEIVSLWG